MTKRTLKGFGYFANRGLLGYTRTPFQHMQRAKYRRLIAEARVHVISKPGDKPGQDVQIFLGFGSKYSLQVAFRPLRRSHLGDLADLCHRLCGRASRIDRDLALNEFTRGADGSIAYLINMFFCLRE